LLNEEIKRHDFRTEKELIKKMGAFLREKAREDEKVRRYLEIHGEVQEGQKSSFLSSVASYLVGAAIGIFFVINLITFTGSFMINKLKETDTQTYHAVMRNARTPYEELAYPEVVLMAMENTLLPALADALYSIDDFIHKSGYLGSKIGEYVARSD